jgi:hypothetical protein
MQFLTLTIFLAVTTATFLTNLQVLPGALKYLPEGLSALAMAYVLLQGPRQRFRYVAARYWLTFAALLVVMFCGALLNGTGSGPLLEGIRFYLRAAPLFFVPAVYDFTERQLIIQMRVLAGLALLQIPVSIYQRYELVLHGHWSGDPVFGTLQISSIMSIFLIGAICIAAGLMMRGYLRRWTFLCLFIALTIPTTINETKGTLFLLPIGLLATLVAASPTGRRLRVAGGGLALIVLFGALFVPIYDFFSTTDNPYPYTVESFFSDERQVGDYLDRGTGVGSRGDVGRVDAITVPLQQFSSDPVRLMFGVGIGNSGRSSLGSAYTGEYWRLFGRFSDESSGGAFLVETGVLGLLCILLLDYFVLRDALAVGLADHTLLGAIALGCFGIAALLSVGTFYKNLHSFESISYLYWYFAGLVAARRMRLALGIPSPTAPLSQPGTPPSRQPQPPNAVTQRRASR